jgi:hypothetical protein
MAEPEEPVADASAVDAPPVSTVPPSRVVKDIVYCGVCLMPAEYCEFDVKTLPKCKVWLKAQHEDLYEKYYAADGGIWTLGRA